MFVGLTNRLIDIRETESKLIILYVKTHRVTGLKYFGKTTKDDPYSYKGSGKHWRRHLIKHGYDVETEIVSVFENVDEATKFALQFSEENNIVNSKEWANLIPENALDGGHVGPNPHHSEVMRGRKVSEETKRKMSEAAKGKVYSKERRENISKGKKGKLHSKEHCENISKGKKGKVQSKENIENRVNSCARTWLVTDSYGNSEIITNLKKFCRENNLNSGTMCQVGKGKFKQHKGYKCEKIST